MNILIKNFDLVLFAFLPVYPLLDFLVLQYGFPFATTIFYIVFGILNCRKLKIELFSPAILIFFYLVCVVLNGLFYGWLYEYDMAIVLLVGSLTTSIILFEKDNCYKYLISFTYFYYFLSIAIFIYRFIKSDLSFLSARGGATFYGGNTGHLILLMMFFLSVYLGKHKDAIILFFMSNLNAILFTSKGAIAIQIIVLFYMLLKMHKLKLKQMFMIIAGFLSIYFLFVWLSRLNLNEVLTTRFMIWLNSLEMGDSFLGTRYLIWKNCVELLDNNSNYLLFGCGLGKFYYINYWGYSNAHNILLDVLFGSGIFGLLTFVYIFIKILFLANHNRILLLLIAAYAIIEGIALFYVNANTSLIWGSALIFFFCSLSLIKKYNLKKWGDKI